MLWDYCAVADDRVEEGLMTKCECGGKAETVPILMCAGTPYAGRKYPEVIIMNYQAKKAKKGGR